MEELSPPPPCSLQNQLCLESTWFRSTGEGYKNDPGRWLYTDPGASDYRLQHRDMMRAVKTFLLLMCYLAITQAWRCTAGPRLSNVLQVDAGQGKVVARDRSGFVYFLIGSSWYRMTGQRFKHVSVGPAGLWATDTSNRVNKYVSGVFRPSGGVAMFQVDAGGDGEVVGIGSSNRAYCLRSTIASRHTGSRSLGWNYLSRVLRYISCGPSLGCWATDAYKRTFLIQKITPTTCGISNLRYISGNGQMVEVGTDGNVFSLNTRGQVMQRLGISSGRPQGTTWRQIPLCLPVRHVSYDLGTLWAVTTSGTIMKCVH